MLSAKKTVTLHPVQNHQRDLEKLYARRTAIESLIQSLEEYDRYKAASASRLSNQRKSA